MLVSRRKLGHNRTKYAVTPSDSSNSEMRQNSQGFRQRSSKGLMGWVETNSSVEANRPLRNKRSVEASGLLRVGLETKFA